MNMGVIQGEEKRNKRTDVANFQDTMCLIYQSIYYKTKTQGDRGLISNINSESVRYINDDHATLENYASYETF
jgi:hypothetical protein